MLIHAYTRKHAIPVELFGTEYLFAAHPDNPKAFVAEVTDDKAIDRLLSITEAYVEYGQPPARAIATSHQPLQPQDNLSAVERELGFKLNPPTDELTPEARAFADAERARLAQEEEDEAEAVAERNRAAAEAAEHEAQQKKAQAEAEARAEAEAKAKAEAEAAAAAARFVLKADDGTVVDLKPMDDAALRQFAKDAGVTGLNSKWKGDTLREKILDALAKPAEPTEPPSTPPAE